MLLAGLADQRWADCKGLDVLCLVSKEADNFLLKFYYDPLEVAENGVTEFHEGARIIAFWMHDACKLFSPARCARNHDRLLRDVRGRIGVLLQCLSVVE